MAYVDSTSATGNSDTPSVAVPTGVASGDIVILACAIDAQAAVFDTGDWPSGFTELGETDITADGHTVAVGWKRLTEADSGSYTFGALGATADWVCQAVALSGRHASNPPVASSFNVQNTPQSSPITVSANGVTAVDGDDLIWISGPDVTSSGAGNGHTAPTDYTEREDAENAWANLSLATRENVSAGATGTVSGTFALSQDTAGWAAILVRVPLAGAAGGVPPITRPVSDVSAGGWTSTPLFDKVDEAVPSDGDSIQSASGPSNDICELALQTLPDPGISIGHILRVRRKKSATSNNQIDMRYRILEGATERASWTDDTNISESAFQTVERVLTTAQIDSITDYSNLRVEIRANQVAGDPAAPTFVGRSASLANTATSGADVTPAMPSGHQADDINIIVAHHSGSLGWATPSGWNVIAGLTGQNGALAQNVAVFWRREVGGDTAPAVSLAAPDNVTTVRGACMYGFRGCISTGDPWDSGAGAGPTRLNDAADDAVVDTTSITTTVANCLVFFVGAYEDDPSGGSQPTGYTTVTARTTATGTDCGIYDCNKTLSGTSTENPSTTLSGGTFANSPHCGILIALKPDPNNVSAQVSWVEFEAGEPHPMNRPNRAALNSLLRM